MKHLQPSTKRSWSTARRGLACAAAAATLLPLLGTLQSQAATGLDLSGAIVGVKAYGSSLTFQNPQGVKVESGPLALQSMPCTVRDGVPVEVRNNVAKVVLVPGLTTKLLDLGAVVNTGTPKLTPTLAENQERSQVAGVKLLGGLITADAVTSTAVTSLSILGYNHNQTGLPARSGVQILNLRIGGVVVPLPSTVQPNTKITLPGSLGYLVLNEQVTSDPLAAPFPSSPKSNSTLTVRGLHLVINDFLGFKGDLDVATAVSRVKPAPGRLYAAAFSTQVTVPKVADLGRQAYLSMPCSGTNGVDNTLTQAGVTLPFVGSTGVAQSIVNGKNGDTLVSKASNKVAGLNLFNGLIKAEAVTSNAQSQAAASGVGPASSTGTASLLNLIINGKAINLAAPKNTRIDLPGLGFVILGHVFCSNDSLTPSDCSKGTRFTSVTARALHVEVTVPGNPLGVPVGVVINIAQSSTSVGA